MVEATYSFKGKKMRDALKKFNCEIGMRISLLQGAKGPFNLPSS